MGATMTGAMSVRLEPSCVASVRRELCLDLDLHGADADAVDDAALVISELMTNALRHGGLVSGGIDVSWTVRACSVMVSVEDATAQAPSRTVADATSSTGRGLTIVDALSSAWGHEATRTGKRVWAIVPLRAA